MLRLIARDPQTHKLAALVSEDKGQSWFRIDGTEDAGTSRTPIKGDPRTWQDRAWQNW